MGAREAGGSDIWVNALNGRTAAGVVATGILSSPESRTKATVL